MDLTSPKNIKDILTKYGATPSKGLGQNFLIDKNILEKIIATSNITKEDVVLEVGPGFGTLTNKLAQMAKQVIAVEKDHRMVNILNETLTEFSNITILEQDILKYTPPVKYKLIANIPYYLTSPLIRKFLEEKNQPQEIILMIQKEVAQRICAKPGDMSILAVSVQFYADPKIISYVSKGCFWPAPKIDSAIIKIIPFTSAQGRPQKYNVDPEIFFKVVKAGFAHPRKQLVNNLTTLKLTDSVKLDKHLTADLLLVNNLKPTQRPETLSVSDWVKLTKHICLFFSQKF